MSETLFGLSEEEQLALFDTLKKSHSVVRGREITEEIPKVDERYLSFAASSAYKQLCIEKEVAKNTGILNPFFKCHDRMAKATALIEGVEYLNFSTYDYLDLNGHPKIKEAAIQAMEKWGTSASASRLVSGERPPHRLLEKNIASLYDAEDCVIYVSGHATNVSTIGKLFGQNDVIFHDALSHNSIVMGALVSGAKRISYPHNDCRALEFLLKEHRFKYQRALIVTEGVFSMDGNVADLPNLVRLKKLYGAFLMVDEAHSLGVLGAGGRGVAEHFSIDPKNVDIWMGTLSKTCCGCGGYIAGSRELIELLKFTSPGFVYSVGMSPVLASASNQALEIMKQEPWRVHKLQKISREFVDYAKSCGLDTGKAEGYAVVPIMLGSSLLAGKLATRLFARHINVMPIIYPVVEEGGARLRFFLSAAHRSEHVRQAIDILCEELPLAQQEVAELTH